MTRKIIITIIQPSDAMLSLPVPTVKRCNTCALQEECKLIHAENNKVRSFYNRVVKTDCNHHVPRLSMINDDEREIDNLKWYCSSSPFATGRPLLSI